MLRGTSTGDNTLSQAIVDPGTSATTLNKLDAGTWVLKNTANSYTGNTVISTGGRLKLGASGVIPDASLVQLFSVVDLRSEWLRRNGSIRQRRLRHDRLGHENADPQQSKRRVVHGRDHRHRRRPHHQERRRKVYAQPNDGHVRRRLDAQRRNSGHRHEHRTRHRHAHCQQQSDPRRGKHRGRLATNAVTLNGNLTFDDSFTTTPGPITWGTSGANKWTITGGERTITVNTAAGGYGVTINQPIGQDAAGLGLVKKGNGTLTLNAANTYTGATTVLAGTLSVSKTFFADWGGVLVRRGCNAEPDFPHQLAGHDRRVIRRRRLPTNWHLGRNRLRRRARNRPDHRHRPLLVEPFVVPPIPGDFNKDGIVDTSDYLTWRKNQGTSIALPNDNGLGTPIGQAHFNLWRQRFGNTPGAGTAAADLAAARFLSQIPCCSSYPRSQDCQQHRFAVTLNRTRPSERRGLSPLS